MQVEEPDRDHRARDLMHSAVALDPGMGFTTVRSNVPADRERARDDRTASCSPGCTWRDRPSVGRIVDDEPVSAVSGVSAEPSTMRTARCRQRRRAGPDSGSPPTASRLPGAGGP
jgi:hypothetical protein